MFSFIYRLLRKKDYFKIDSKLAENSRNHVFHILTTLGSDLSFRFIKSVTRTAQRFEYDESQTLAAFSPQI